MLRMTAAPRPALLAAPEIAPPPATCRGVETFRDFVADCLRHDKGDCGRGAQRLVWRREAQRD